MKRKGSIIFLFVLMLILSSISVYAADVSIEGNQVTFTQASGHPFVDTSNRTQVPLRVTMESFGCTVRWDQTNQTAIVEKDGITVKVPVGAKYILKDGVRIENDTAALIKDSRTYLPIRAVLEAFGAEVSWDGSTQTVLVSSPVGNSAPMTIHFIDVGQADSIFIDYGNYEVLVDGGNNGDGSLVVNYIKPYIDGNLELMIGTHSDADHIGGLDTVLSAYQVDKIIYSEETKDTVTYKDFLDAAAAEPGASLVGDSDMSFNMGNGAYLKVMEMGDGYKDSNENSVVSMVDYNNVEILLMGDLESTVESKYLDKFQDVDVLKAGHHGSSTSSNRDFLNVVKPEIVIISAGKANQYGHPHIEAIERLFNIEASVYGTFKSGTIILTTDGNTYSLNTNTKLSVSDAGAGAPVTEAPSTPPASNVSTDNGSPAQTDAAYIGNGNTLKFHLPSCRYVPEISQTNKVLLNTRAEAISAGYVPCKVCNP
ncbi:MAG: stalk domain-containing protein [Eubacteriales bacterium]|nr:stalk domain-containing protein [Eubacteriales bacterium]